VANLRRELRDHVFRKIATEEGEANLIAGRLDGEIQSMVTAIAREVSPHQIIAASTADRSEADTFTDHAMASQAFGAQLALGDTDLFMMAKSAILQTLTEADRRNIQTIKQTILTGNHSPTFQRRLSQYYGEIARYLRGRKTDDAIIELIYQSKYIYFDERVEKLPGPSLALGITDGFVTLRDAGRLTLEILGVLPGRLQKLLPAGSSGILRSVEGLLRDSCYNEFRRSIAVGLSGGDHCDFFQVGPKSHGLIIFDVSGHSEQASGLRDLLVQAIEKLPDRNDPARVLNTLNRFALRYPFPEDIFVTMVYGVIDAGEGKFTYANAGHHPPYLVRKSALRRLEGIGGIALNMGDDEYQNGYLRLELQDSLVLYTDGLTEASHAKEAGGKKELFGTRRLEDAIAEKKIGALKAKRAVESILAAVRDQGFQIEDDISIQVYRHV